MLFVQLQGWMKHKFNVHDYESTPPFNICSISWCSSYGKSWDFIFACVNLPFEYHTDKCNLCWCSSLSKDKQHVERIARPNSQGRFYKPCLVLIFVKNYEDHWQEEQALMFEISGEKTVMVLKGFPVKGLNTSWQVDQQPSLLRMLWWWEERHIFSSWCSCTGNVCRKIIGLSNHCESHIIVCKYFGNSLLVLVELRLICFRT